jgi:hypothetical protein
MKTRDPYTISQLEQNVRIRVVFQAWTSMSETRAPHPHHHGHYGKHHFVGTLLRPEEQMALRYVYFLRQPCTFDPHVGDGLDIVQRHYVAHVDDSSEGRVGHMPALGYYGLRS